jgi:LmbE family N-acetylglucosaminyl deacetylase
VGRVERTGELALPLLSIPCRMRSLRFPSAVDSILCVGAHSDDIEIGCGGTILTLLAAYPDSAVHWVVLSAAGQRGDEARKAAELFLGTSERHRVQLREFPDGFFPYVGGDVKRFFEQLKLEIAPDIVFTHARWDRHQDHRLVNELTWNTFRDHLILEFEIPKYDGDLGNPNCYVPLTDDVVERKVRHLLNAFASQATKRWFTEDTFRGLMRLRGIEAGGTERYAEGFFAPKLVLGPVEAP